MRPEDQQTAMLKSVSEQVRECYEHAEYCARKAAAQTDPTIKQDYLDLERHWLTLARSHEFTERLNDFSAMNQKALNPLKRPLDK
jgi:hypothetical protein